MVSMKVDSLSDTFRENIRDDAALSTRTELLTRRVITNQSLPDWNRHCHQRLKSGGMHEKEIGNDWLHDTDRSRVCRHSSNCWSAVRCNRLWIRFISTRPSRQILCRLP